MKDSLQIITCVFSLLLIFFSMAFSSHYIMIYFNEKECLQLSEMHNTKHKAIGSYKCFLEKDGEWVPSILY